MFDGKRAVSLKGAEIGPRCWSCLETDLIGQKGPAISPKSQQQSMRDNVAGEELYPTSPAPRWTGDDGTGGHISLLKLH